MENQFGTDTPNTPQVGSNPAGHPAKIIGKPAVNRLIIFAASLLVLLIIAALGRYLSNRPGENVFSRKEKTLSTLKQTLETSKTPNQKDLPLDFSAVWTLERDWLANEDTPQGGTKLEQSWLTVYIPREALPANAKVGFAIVPEPADENLSNVYLNTSFQISGPRGGSLPKNLVIYQPLSVSNPRLALLHKETLNYYFWDKEKSEWVPVPSLINLAKGCALAKYNKLGTYSLRGNPINKAPGIFSVEPNKIKYQQDIVITIRGENFQRDSLINFGMGGFRFEFIDEGTLSVRMKEGDNFLISPGTYTLKIRNPDGQGTHLLEALTVED